MLESKRSGPTSVWPLSLSFCICKTGIQLTLQEGLNDAREMLIGA